MFDYFRAENFRGLEDLEIDGLERVNLIAGKNNVGKTALLEAMWIRHGYHNPALPISADQSRGKQRLSSEEFLWDIFTRFDPSRTIRLTFGKSKEQRETLEIEFREQRGQQLTLTGGPASPEDHDTSDAAESRSATTAAGYEVIYRFGDKEGRIEVQDDEANVESMAKPNDYPNAMFSTARGRSSNELLADRLSRANEHKKSDRIVSTLDVFEPEIQDLQVNYSEGSGPTIVCDIGWEDRLVPLGVMGAGVARLLELALAFVDSEGGLVFIDEIENGLHHSVHESIWKNIAELAREFDTQVFATTHSYECIEAAHRAFDANDGGYDFQLIRLEERDGIVDSVQYDRDKLDAAIEGGFEVR